MKICLWGMLISLAVLLITFYATDWWTGDKEFSQYTADDWAITIFPLSVMAVSCVSTLTFSLITMIPMIVVYPALMDYVTNKKFSNLDENTEFIIFDHNELKRACCHLEGQDRLWFSVKEYNLKKKDWVVLEEGRFVNNLSELSQVLQTDYNFDRIKYSHIQASK